MKRVPSLTNGISNNFNTYVEDTTIKLKEKVEKGIRIKGEIENTFVDNSCSSRKWDRILKKKESDLYGEIKWIENKGNDMF